MDVVSPKVRSRMMSGIRGKDTRPELIVRRGLHAAGFRFVLHSPRLPGRPDLSFPRFQAVVFVNGCFWHAHEGCRDFVLPATRREFWSAKLLETRSRDARVRQELVGLGWRVATAWECAVRRDAQHTVDRLALWLRDVDATPTLDISAA